MNYKLRILSVLLVGCVKIAIIDDTNFHLKNLALKLNKMGYTDVLEINTSINDDIFYINFNYIDLVFLDVMMPRTDAIDVINLCLSKKNKLLIFSSARQELINITYEFAKIKGYNCIGCVNKDVSMIELNVIFNKLVLENSKQKEDYEILEYEAVKGMFNGSLISYYQPKIDVYSLNIVGLEVLARLSHEKHGILTPNKFIGTYEKYDLLTVLFYNQIEDCCQFFKEKKLDLYLSINIPHSTLMSEPKLHEKVKSICDIYDFTMEKLILEITEGQAYSPNSYELENISKLSMLGVKFSLDDFGSGYSTLKSMNQIPFYEVKIDKFFVDNIHENKKLISGLVYGAKSKGLIVTAEGVEDMETFEILKDIGVDIVQGFLFYKPMSETDITREL